MDILYIDELPKQSQVLLKNLTRIEPLLRTLGYQNKQMQNVSSKSLRFASMGMAFIQEQIGYALAYNYSNPRRPGCDGGKYNFNISCGKSDAVFDSILITPPGIQYRPLSQFITISLCQKAQKFNNFLNIDILNHVFCLEVRLESLKEYFQNYAKSSVQAYLIEPISQTVIFDSTKPFNEYSTKTLTEMEFNYQQSQSDVQIFNNTLQKNFKQKVYEKAVRINKNQHSSLDKLTIEFEYNRNGTQNYVIINPIYLIDKYPQFVGVKNPLPKIYDIQLILAQINIISNEQLMQNSSKLQLFFNNYYLGYLISFICVAVISLFFSIIYSIKLTKLFNEPINHLIQVIKKIELEKSNVVLYNILTNSQENSDNIFLSYETRELYQSFQAVFQLLVFTSENFFFENEGETLLKLNRKIEFFKQFKNDYAVGISHNNIGSILLKQGHYFQALEHFQTAIIYAKYEIQSFLIKNPDSIPAKQISEYLQVYDYKKNQQKKNSSSFQTKKQNTNSTKFSNQRQTASSNKQINNDVNNYFQKEETNEINKSPHHEIIQEVDKNDHKTDSQINNTDFCSTAKIFKKSKSKQHQIQFSVNNKQQEKQQNDDDQEQIIKLSSNLFYRQQNFISALIAFQESRDVQTNKTQVQNKGFNFWNEIKNLIKKQIILCLQLPFGKTEIAELLGLISKCHLNLNKIKESHIALMNSEKFLKNLQIIAQQNQNFELNQQENQEIINKYISFQDQQHFEDLEFQQNGSQTNKNFDKSINQTNQGNEVSQFDNYETQMKHKKTNEVNDFCETQQQKILVISETQFDSFNLKQQRNRAKSSSLVFFNSFQNKLNKSSRSNTILFTPKAQNIQNQHSCVRFRRETLRLINDSIQDRTNNIFEEKEQLINYIKSEYFVKTEKYYGAALTLTSLLENYQYLMSHFPYKIANQLKNIFEICNIKLKEFDEFNQKFNSNIQTNVAIVYSYKKEPNQSYFQSVSLFKELVVLILNFQKDKIGILIYNNEENIIIQYMSLMKIPLVYQLIDQIALDLEQSIYIRPVDSFLDLVKKNTIQDSKKSKGINKIQDKQKESEQSENQFYSQQTDTNLLKNNEQVENNFKKYKFSLVNSKQNLIDKSDQKYQLQSNKQSLKIQKNIDQSICEQTDYLLQSKLNSPNHSYYFIQQKSSFNTQNELSNQIQLQIDKNVGDELDSFNQRESILELDLSQTDIEIQNNIFYECIQSTLNDYFIQNIIFRNSNMKIYLQNYLKKNQTKELNKQHDIKHILKMTNNWKDSQQNYIIYATNKITTLNDTTFEKMCQILYYLNVQLIIFPNQKGNSFLEEYSDFGYQYQEKQVIKICYQSSIIINYLKFQRDHLTTNIHPTYIQHY